MSDWESIRCADVEWRSVPGASSRAAIALYQQCRLTGHETAKWAERKWHNLTLGELAAKGERWWRQSGEKFGDVTIEAIKLAIDYAAAGYEICRKEDAYEPRPLPAPKGE